MIRRKLLLVAIATLPLIALSLYFVNARSSNRPDGYSRIDGYVHVEPGQATCAALIPSCGYCAGEVIEKECYVKKPESN